MLLLKIFVKQKKISWSKVANLKRSNKMWMFFFLPFSTPYARHYNPLSIKKPADFFEECSCLKLSQNKKGRKIFQLHHFLNLFLQLASEEKDSKNGAARNFFDPTIVHKLSVMLAAVKKNMTSKQFDFCNLTAPILWGTQWVKVKQTSFGSVQEFSSCYAPDTYGMCVL